MLLGIVTGALIGLLVALAKGHITGQAFQTSYIRNGALLFAAAGLVAGPVVNAVFVGLCHFLWGLVQGEGYIPVLHDAPRPTGTPFTPRYAISLFWLGVAIGLLWWWS